MPKKKPQSVDSTKSQAKAPAKKTRATPKSDTKATTAKSESMTYSRVTNSVVDRIRSMVSDPTNTLTTPRKSTKKKRVVPAKTAKKPTEYSSAHMPTPPTAPVDMKVSDVDSQTGGKATNSVIERIRSMVSEPTNTATSPEHSPKKKRVASAKAPKKLSTDASSRVTIPQPAKPSVTTASKAQPTNNSVRLPMPEQDATPDSYEIPFDVDDYLRDKEAPKQHLNRVQERTASPSSRGWVLVHMSHGEFPQKKLKCGLLLYWQVPHDIGKMYLGDHVFLCQSEGVKAGIIGHGYVANLPTLWSDVHRPRIVHNVKKPNTHTHVISVRVVSAHQRLEYPVMRSLPLVSTINIPTMHIPYRQPLTTEQTFALLELWYM